MITLQETTKSFLECTLHTYLVSDDKMTLYGYIINGTTEIKMLNTPLKFNKKGRTFKKLKG